MKTIITVQHTEAVHHLNGHIGSRYEWELTEKGRREAFLIGEWLARNGCGEGFAMYVSPQVRTMQTAAEINRTLMLDPLPFPALREVDVGQAAGRTIEWTRAHAAPGPDVYDPDYRPFPDAESDRDVWNRLYPFYRMLLDEGPERVLIVSHGTALSFFQSMMIGQKLEDRGAFHFGGRSGSISLFKIDDSGRVTAEYVNRRIY